MLNFEFLATPVKPPEFVENSFDLIVLPEHKAGSLVDIGLSATADFTADLSYEIVPPNELLEIALDEDVPKVRYKVDPSADKHADPDKNYVAEVFVTAGFEFPSGSGKKISSQASILIYFPLGMQPI